MRRRRGRYDLSDPAKSGRSYRRYPSGWRRRNESSWYRSDSFYENDVYSEVETEILKDMYSLDRECVLEKKEGIYEEMLMYNQAKCKIAERLTLPELKEDVLQIIHSEGSIQAESERYTEEEWRLKEYSIFLFSI